MKNGGLSTIDIFCIGTMFIILSIQVKAVNDSVEKLERGISAITSR